jgi:hypothetical protein
VLTAEAMKFRILHGKMISKYQSEGKWKEAVITTERNSGTKVFENINFYVFISKWYALKFGKYIFWNAHDYTESRDSSVRTATGYGLEAGVRFPAGEFLSLLHGAQTESGAHLASYTMGIGGSFPGGKAAGAWSWPLISI